MRSSGTSSPVCSRSGKATRKTRSTSVFAIGRTSRVQGERGGGPGQGDAAALQEAQGDGVGADAGRQHVVGGAGGELRGDQQTRRKPLRQGALPDAGGGHPAQAGEEERGQQPPGVGGGEPRGAVVDGAPVDRGPDADQQQREGSPVSGAEGGRGGEAKGGGSGSGERGVGARGMRTAGSGPGMFSSGSRDTAHVVLSRRPGDGVRCGKGGDGGNVPVRCDGAVSGNPMGAGGWTTRQNHAAHGAGGRVPAGAPGALWCAAAASPTVHPFTTSQP